MFTILKLSFGRAFFILLMKPTLTFLVVFLLANQVFSQTDTVIRYLTWNLEEAQKREEIAYEVITITSKTTDGYYLVQDFFAETGKKIQQQYLDGKDSSTKVGPYVSYHKNGAVRTRGSFVKGKKIGIWTSWYDSKAISDSCFYNDQGNIQGLAKKWWESGATMDSANYHADSSGHAYTWTFFSNGALSGEGPCNNLQEDGNWNFYYPSGKIAAKEVYANGKWISMQCFNEDGSTTVGKCEPEIDADFPGGNEAWQKYIVNGVARRIEAMSKDNAIGKAVVLFIVDKDGKITEVRIDKSSGTALDKYAIDIIKKAPKWIPARQHNRFVKAYRKQPVTFNLEEQ
jgi:TonB family protein